MEMFKKFYDVLGYKDRDKPVILCEPRLWWGDGENSFILVD
jgi:hypothetical protein